MRKVFLDNLPRWGKEGMGNSGTINWKGSIGLECKFIYDEIEGYFKIIDYEPIKQVITLDYKNEISKMFITSVKKGCMGKVLKKATIDFKIKIGTFIKDKNRDLTIVSREYKTDKKGRKYKYYNYKCNKCGYEGWIIESNLISKKQGCACCTNKVVVEGINDIPTTAPWMVKYFQGGYDEAKKYTCQSMKKIHPICPDCGRVKDKTVVICNLYRTHSIGCICSDNISFGEKVLLYLLDYYKNNNKISLLIFQLTKIKFDWCKSYKYDFYIEVGNEKYIIEVNGEQHYNKGFMCNGARTVAEEKKNDLIKKELALYNGIKDDNYIILDCRISDIWYIKKSIFNSKLNNIFDLDKIDWNSAFLFASKSFVKEMSDYYNSGLKSRDIAQKMYLSRYTVIKYLKRATELGLCSYDSKKEIKEGGCIRSTPIKCLNDNKIYPSVNNCAKNSLDNYGVKLCASTIRRVCKNEISNTKNFTFQYV